MAKTCEICHRKIGFFDGRHTTTDKKLICKICFEKYKKAVPFYLESENKSAADIAEATDSPEALAYCNEHGLPNFPENHRKKEAEKQKKADEIEKEWKEQQKAEAEIEEQRKKRMELAKRQLILNFSISGMKYHDIGKAIAFARKEEMFVPYDNVSDRALKDDPYEKTYETDLSGIISNVDFVSEPDNKYDSNAIKFLIEIKDKKFMIGYVPKQVNKKMASLLKDFHEGKIAMGVSASLSGGKYKEAVDDPNNFSDTPKPRIYTGVDDYEFYVEVSDKNRK